MLAFTTTMLVAGVYGSAANPEVCKEETFLNSCKNQFVDAGGCTKAVQVVAAGDETALFDLAEELHASGAVEKMCFKCDNIQVILTEKCEEVVLNPECEEETFIEKCVTQFMDADGCHKALGASEDDALEEMAKELVGEVDPSCFVCENVGDRFTEECLDDLVEAINGATSNIGLIIGISVGVLFLISCLMCIVCLCPCCCVAAAAVKAGQATGPNMV